MTSPASWILTVTPFSAPLWYCKECGALCSIFPLETILPLGNFLESLQRHLEAAYLNGMLLVLKLILKDMLFLLWQVLHSNSHAILLSSMSEKHSVPLGASGVMWRTPQMPQSQIETALYWKFICGIVVASITWSQTLLVFTIKPFSWGALFSWAPPGQQRWTLLGIIVKQGGSIKSTVVWLFDLDSS